MADWVNLPTDIFILIAQCLEYMEDVISLSVVCKSWHSVIAMLGEKPVLPPRFPWVMLTEIEEANQLDEDQKSVVNFRQFYSFLTSKIYKFELPEASHRMCLTTNHGWLFTVGYDLQINLLHPFSRQQIKLPPLLTLPDQYEYDETFKPEEVVPMFVTKVVMSKNPDQNHKKFFFNDDGNKDCIIVAIYGELRVLAFTRPGDEKWTNISVSSKVYEDIAYYQGKFYAVNFRGALFVCEFEGDDGPKAILLAAPAPPGTNDWDQKYLVESSRHLLVVCRLRGGTIFNDLDERNNPNMLRYYTVGFLVFKLEVECYENNEGGIANCKYKLTEVKDLGGRALFLGNNASVSVPSSECVKPNCIYFGEDDGAMYLGEPEGGGRDTGIFDMINGTVESHFAAKFCCPLCPPMWYI